jgi:hypothetical protein
VAVQALPADLAGLGQLRIVDAGHNALRSWKSVQALPDLPRLRQLNLMGNPLTTADNYRAKVRAELSLEVDLCSMWDTYLRASVWAMGSMSGTSFNKPTCLRSRLWVVLASCVDKVCRDKLWPFYDVDSAKKAALGPLPCLPHRVCCCSCWSWPQGSPCSMGGELTDCHQGRAQQSQDCPAVRRNRTRHTNGQSKVGGRIWGTM